MPKSHRWLKRNLTVPRAETLEAATALPASMDLRSHFGDVDDQGSLGSCTAFASTAALEYMFKKQGTQTPEEFSRLFDEAKKIHEILKAGRKLPGDCRNKVACEAYCKNPGHMEECLAFAKESGFLSKEELEEAEKVLAGSTKEAVTV